MVFFSRKKSLNFLAELIKIKILYLVYKNPKNFRVPALKSCGSFIMRVFTALGSFLYASNARQECCRDKKHHDPVTSPVARVTFDLTLQPYSVRQ